MPYVPNGMKGRTTKLLLRQEEQASENLMNSCLKNVNSSHHKISWHLFSFTTKYSPQRHALKSSTPTSFSFQTLCIAFQKHVSDFRPRWATLSWHLGPSVFQTLTVLCKSWLFIRAHFIYSQIPRLHNDTWSSRRLFVHTVLIYRVSQKAEFLEYLNDYELLEDSPPSLQLFNDLSTLLTILRAERSGVSVPSTAGHVSLPQNVQTCSRAHPASYTIATAFFPRGKAARA